MKLVEEIKCDYLWNARLEVKAESMYSMMVISWSSSIISRLGNEYMSHM
jgi:hypothetical protein